MAYYTGSTSSTSTLADYTPVLIDGHTIAEWKKLKKEWAIERITRMYFFKGISQTKKPIDYGYVDNIRNER